MADEATDTQTTEATETTTETAAPEATEQSPEAKADDASALGGEAKVGEAKPEETAAPEKYELTPPEGFETLDADTLAEAEPVFRELGLSNEGAQSLIPIAGKFAQRILSQAEQKMLGEVSAQRKAWLDEARADEEVGGAKWDESLEMAGKALDAMGYPKGSPFRTFLNESGLGNNVHMIRWAVKVGKAVSEDSDFVRGSPGVQARKPTEELWYGNKE